jgi:hypothetical protein
MTLDYISLSDEPGGSTSPADCTPCPENSTTSTPCGDVTGIYKNLLIYCRTFSVSYG